MIVDSDELTWGESGVAEQITCEFLYEIKLEKHQFDISGTAVTIFTILVGALIFIALAKFVALAGLAKLLGYPAISILTWLGVIKNKK